MTSKNLTTLTWQVGTKWIIHLRAISWFCSSFVAAANWRFNVFRSSFSTATLSAAAGCGAAAFAPSADMDVTGREQQAWDVTGRVQQAWSRKKTAGSPQTDPAFSPVLPCFLLFTSTHDPRNMATYMSQNGPSRIHPDSIYMCVCVCVCICVCVYVIDIYIHVYIQLVYRC